MSDKNLNFDKIEYLNFKRKITISPHTLFNILY